MKNKFTRHIGALIMLVIFCSASTVQAQNVDIYTGVLKVDISGIGGDVISSPDQILLQKNGEDKINLTLKDFDFQIIYLGDIVIDDIPVTMTADGKSEFKSDVISMILAGGDIHADVQVTGYTKDGKTEIQIDVEWLGIVIPVSFEGTLQSDGLRLSDIKVNGEILNWTNINGDNLTFNPDVFNYSGVAIGATDVITFTKADAGSTVDVEMDGNWIYLYVSKDGKRNKYTLADAGIDPAVGSRPIIKMTIGQNVDGNLVLRNESEIAGTSTVAGTISYYQPFSGTTWSAIGLPYELSFVNVVKADGSETPADAYWYSYNDKGEQVDLSTMSGISMTKLKINSDAVALNLISKLGSSITKDNAAPRAGYNVVPNSSLESSILSDFGAYDTYYIFNGTEFTQTSATTELAPASMFIGYVGTDAPSTIEAPDPGKTGIETIDADALNVYAQNGQVYIYNFSGVAKVYSLNGVNVLNQAVDGEANFSLTNGLYIIQTGSKAKVIIVR